MEKINEKELAKLRKKNMKLYSIYRMFSIDVVFMYAIKFIFLTQVKEINASDVILSTSMYALFVVFFQIPATIIVNKLGYIKSAFISNILNVIYIIMIMLSTNLVWLLIAEFISCIVYSIKEIADPSLLDMSIPKTNNKREIFSKIEGRGSSNYFYLDAITAILSGFLYGVNPYIPFICSAICVITSCFLSLKFEEIDVKNKDKDYNISQLRDDIIDLKKSFSIVIGSKRLRALILYSGIIWGFHCIFADYKTNLLTDLNVSSQLIGIIVAILGIVSGIAAKRQQKIHQKYRNKSLTVLGIFSAFPMLISGLIIIFTLPVYISVGIIIFCSMSNYASRAIYDVLIKRYLGNFADKDLLPKIYSVHSLGKNLLRAIIGISGAFVIGVTSATYIAVIIMGSIFCVLMFAVVIYMKSRVGLDVNRMK